METADWWIVAWGITLMAILGCYDAGRWRPIWRGWEETEED